MQNWKKSIVTSWIQGLQGINAEKILPFLEAVASEVENLTTFNSGIFMVLKDRVFFISKYYKIISDLNAVDERICC